VFHHVIMRFHHPPRVVRSFVRPFLILLQHYYYYLYFHGENIKKRDLFRGSI